MYRHILSRTDLYEVGGVESCDIEAHSAGLENGHTLLCTSLATGKGNVALTPQNFTLTALCASVPLC